MSLLRASVAAAVLLLLAAPPALAQLPQTRLGTLVPPGGQAGTTFEVRVSGEQDLEYETAPRLLFNHSGVTAEPVVDPTTGAWQNNTFRVAVAADVPPQRYDARLAGYYGASNPRSFRIEANPTQREESDVPPDSPVALPADNAFYGRIESAADVDAFAFTGDAGRTVLLRCDAMSLDSPLQPVMELTAPDGRRLAFAGGAFRGEALLPIVLPTTGEYRINLADAAYRGGPDFIYRIEVAARPVVVAVWPPAGVAGQTATFDLYGYNLPGGELVSGSEPLVRRTVEIALPPDATTLPSSPLTPAQTVIDGFDYVFREGSATADSLPIYFSPRPLIPETEPNDEPATAMRLTLPAEVAGRFERSGDADRFLFDAKKGDAFFIEAFARRYGSPADPVLTIDQVTGPDGQPKERRIAAADDNPDNVAPNAFDTASDDPLLRFETPEDGTYRVTLRDRYFASRGDPTLVYRLSVRQPEPDFRLAVVPMTRDKPDAPASPWAVSLRKGESVAVPVYAFRRDGFADPIRVTAENLPPGLSTAGVTIGEGQTSAALVLTAVDDAATWQGPITVIGEASLPTADGTTAQIRREARVGTIVRGGQNQPAESRLAGPLIVSILDESLPFRLTGEGGAVRVGQGSQVLIPLAASRREGYAEPINVAVEGLPNDAKVAVEVSPIVPGESAKLVRLVIDPQAPPRHYGLAFKGIAKIDYARFPLRLKRAKAAQETAAQAFAKSDEALKQSTAARDLAVKTLEATQAAAAGASDPAKPQAALALESLKTALAALEATIKAAEESRKQAEATKTAADPAAADAEKAAALAKLDYASPAPSVALSIAPAPATFTVEPANGGQLKRGESLDVKVTAKRQNGFEGPIRLSLALPQNVAGLTAEPTTLEPAQTETTLRITAAPDAPEGDVPFPALHTESDHDGPLLIDVPFTLKIAP